MRHLWSQRLMLLGIFAFCITLAMGNVVYAQEEAAAPEPEPVAAEEPTTLDFLKSISIGGFVDTYYSYNFNRPSSRGPGRSSDAGTVFSEANVLRAFDRQDNSFTLSNIELQVVKPSTEESPVGFGFVTLYGEIANFMTFVESHGRVDSFTPGGNSFTVAQGYATYKAPIGKGLDLKMGKFATWIGAELWESVDNPNYSRSYLYNLAIPFTHTGLAATYPFTDKLTISGFLVNGWDTFVDNNTAKTLGYQIAYALSDTCSFWLNGAHGAEQPGNSHDVRHFWDFIWVYSPWDKLKFNFNYDHGTEENVGNWHGLAIIAQYFFTDAFDIAVRGEWFKDSGSRSLGGLIGSSTAAIEVYEVTTTFNIKVRNNLYVRPEFRYDWANGKNADGVFPGTRDNQTTAAVGVAYIF
ncbi:MAG TPA: porin [Candidatus Brocadiia bacterium]|nr:porin [Planctomycetota bacterium]MDO8091904.1 porin [Candidatus Brocadiales bacterium]